MNTGLIKKTKTLRYPDFSIGTIKTARVVTRNYTNLVMYMSEDKLALLSWLIFQCGMDNRIKYKTQLLKRFIGSIKAVEDHYKVKTDLNITLSWWRWKFRELIEDGYILSYGEELVLNPLLTYHADYITKKGYQLLMETPMNQIAEKYVQMVNEKVYGKAYRDKIAKKT